MNLPQLSIRRPVLVLMLSGALMLFGMIGYKNIGLSRLPNVDFPMISILTTYVGADPQIIDASITSTIENAVNGISAIKTIQSFSLANVSMIIVEFELQKNLDSAFNEVQARVNQILSELPREIDPPIVSKVQLDSQPIAWVAVTGDRTLPELSEYATTKLQKRLETIDGIGSVAIYGQQQRTLRVELDLSRMAAFQITTTDVLAAFSAEHIQLAGGFIINKTTEHLLNLDLEFHSALNLADLIVSSRDGLPIKLHDIAKVIDGANPPRKLARINNKPAVILGFKRTAAGNIVQIIDEIRHRLDTEIIPTLPAGIKVSMPLDDAEYIEKMVGSLTDHLWIGTLLASLIVWIFLRNFRSTLIIAITIPISLLGAIFSMYLCGYTMNVITLLSLLLLIGIVVDDAIVILENIYKRQERYTSNRETSAIEGTEEVMFAVLASTFTIIAIFAPVIFMSGIIGRFFESFAVVVTVGVLISLFVAVSLTPMLCSRFLQVTHNEKHSVVYDRLEQFFIYIETQYQRLLVHALGAPKTVIALTGLVCLFSFLLLLTLGSEFVPIEDEGRFMINVTTPIGSNIEYTDKKLHQVEDIIRKQAGIENIITYIDNFGDSYTNIATIFVKLQPFDKRTVSQKKVIADLREPLSKLDGIDAIALPVPVVGSGARGEPLQFAIEGPDFEKAVALAKQLMVQLENTPHFGAVFLDTNLHAPEYKLVIDRVRAQSLGLTAAEIGRTLAVLGGGYDVARYSDEKGHGERYKIRLASLAGEMNQPDDLSQIYVRGTPRDGGAGAGDLVRLDTVAHLESSSGPSKITRGGLQYSAEMFANPKISLGDAITLTQSLSKDLLPLDYHLVLRGQADVLVNTTQVIKMTLILALILVYMVLASQFNSFSQPLIIMVAQPLAMAGAIYALFLTHSTINIYSMIGIVLLMGLVAKNSILLIDLTNERRKVFANNINLALLDACPQRLRPVLMTSLTVILAMLPSAIGLGAGSEGNAPLAIAVVGGMIFSTFLTLLVVPCVYSKVEYQFDEWRNKYSYREEGITRINWALVYQDFKPKFAL